jgi:hypothetical protein
MAAPRLPSPVVVKPMADVVSSWIGHNLPPLSPSTLVKVLRKKRRHHQHVYQAGLNICSTPFTPDECMPGGFYGCELQHLLEWVTLYPDVDAVAFVDVPPNAWIAWFPTKFKASSLILHDAVPVIELLEYGVAHGWFSLHKYEERLMAWCASVGRTDMTAFLLKHGDYRYLCEYGDDAVCTAMKRGHTDWVTSVLTFFPNVSFPRTLDEAARRGNTAMVQLLIQHGTPASASALYIASTMRQAGAYRLLAETLAATPLSEVSG